LLKGFPQVLVSSAELIEKLAKRGEEITEKGGTLRTQVLNDEAEED